MPLATVGLPCWLRQSRICLHWSESESCSVTSDSLRPHGLYSHGILQARILVGSLPLLHGSFSTQRSNPGLPHCRWILYQLSHKRSVRILEWVISPFSRGSSRPRNRTGVSCIAGRFFTNWVIRDVGSILWSLTSPGEGNGNPLQYSCLENSLDRGAWWAIIHGVVNSWTWLSDEHFHFSHCILYLPLFFFFFLPIKREIRVKYLSHLSLHIFLGKRKKVSGFSKLSLTMPFLTYWVFRL